MPYVAWSEDDGTNSELRVSRLNTAATAWQQLVGGASPINHAANQDVCLPSLTAVAGVPYVAWHEYDGTNTEVRVSRLEPEFTSQTAVASATGATLRADVHTYGIPYPIGFHYGPALASETAADPAPAGSDHVTITSQLGGLRPSTSHPFRPFATAGVPAPKVLGAIDAFTTLAAPGSGTRLAFGAKTLVTLKLAARRIPAAGPLPVRVTTRTASRSRASSQAGPTRKRRVRLKAKSFTVAARGHTTVKLSVAEAAAQGAAAQAPALPALDSEGQGPGRTHPHDRDAGHGSAESSQAGTQTTTHRRSPMTIRIRMLFLHHYNTLFRRGMDMQHNETLIRRGWSMQHNETLVRRGMTLQHNETVVRR